MSPPSSGLKKNFPAAGFMLVSYLAYSLTLKNEVTCFSETPVGFQRTIRRYIPEDRTLSSIARVTQWTGIVVGDNVIHWNYLSLSMVKISFV
jgi:hypothetical protein